MNAADVKIQQEPACIYVREKENEKGRSCGKKRKADVWVLLVVSVCRSNQNTAKHAVSDNYFSRLLFPSCYMYQDDFQVAWC